MSDILRIVEKFTMTVDTPPPGRDAWFLDYVLRSPKEAGRHLTAGWLAMNALKEVYRGDEIQTCEEWFGGIGAQALMAERLFNLRAHYIGEYDHDAVRHIYNALPQGKHINVGWRDAYDLTSVHCGYDLQILDFGDLTVWKTRDGEDHRLLLDRVFSKQPKAVLITDIACRYLHLHRERYETLLGPGTCGSYETYLQALADRLEALYGYVLLEGFYDRWSTVMALVPAAHQLGEFKKTPASPVGLELF